MAENSWRKPLRGPLGLVLSFVFLVVCTTAFIGMAGRTWERVQAGYGFGADSGTFTAIRWAPEEGGCVGIFTTGPFRLLPDQAILIRRPVARVHGVEEEDCARGRAVPARFVPEESGRFSFDHRPEVFTSGCSGCASSALVTVVLGLPVHLLALAAGRRPRAGT